MTRLGNDLVHLEARQLSAFTGLGTLCHLDLDLFGIYQIFNGHTKTTAGHLLGLTAEADAVDLGMEALGILAALTRITTGAQLVHGQTDGLVSLF